MLPGATADDESACCREMGSDCDHGNMLSSHSCCQTLSGLDQASLAKASFKLAVNLFYLGQPDLGLNLDPRQTSHAVVSLGHSPPEASPTATEILRI